MPIFSEVHKLNVSAPYHIKIFTNKMKVKATLTKDSKVKLLSIFVHITQDFSWPMEGFLLPFAPPVKRASQKKVITAGNGISLLMFVILSFVKMIFCNVIIFFSKCPKGRLI